MQIFLNIVSRIYNLLWGDLFFFSLPKEHR